MNHAAVGFAITFLVVLALLALSACATVDQTPPEAKIVYRDNLIDRPIPCFRESDRPTPPEPTPVDVENATTEQLAAAAYADQIAYEKYARSLEDLFNQCRAVQGPKEPK